MILSTKYDWGEFVYLKTDSEQVRFIITAIQVNSPTSICYHLCNGKYKAWHDEIELSDEIDISIKIKNF